MSSDNPEFRLFYFTKNYKETVAFYSDLLQLEKVRSWDRGELDRGTIFLSPNGTGWIEIEEGSEIPLLQCGLYIEVENVDQWYEKALARGIRIVQPLTDTSYGHRHFKMEDPNKLTISLFRYNK